MNALDIATLLAKLTQLAITELPTVEAALQAHWGKDHVAQAQQGLTLLQSTVANVAQVFDGDPAQANASPEMEQAAPALPAKS